MNIVWPWYVTFEKDVFEYFANLWNYNYSTLNCVICGNRQNKRLTIFKFLTFQLRPFDQGCILSVEKTKMQNFVSGCSFLRAPSGMSWGKMRKLPKISAQSVSYLDWPEVSRSRTILAKSVMKVKPETVELSGEKTAPKYTFSFPAKVNFQFSQRWEDSLRKLLDENFDPRHRQSGWVGYISYINPRFCHLHRTQATVRTNRT